ncbi:hypothetical protein MKW94_005113, partial [Papaver nudicaule]|nr:hypothetical protein [Papaver nudicaule]
MAGGTDDHGAVLGDWAISNPSPRTFFSSIMGGEEISNSGDFFFRRICFLCKNVVIEPGLSPTTLLDSPVFLSNSLAQPSPTTGKFSFALSNRNNNFKDSPFEEFDSSSFVFKPHAEPNSLHFPGGGTKLPPASNLHESYTKNSVQVQSKQSLQAQNRQADKFQFGNRTDLHQNDLLHQSIEKESNGKNIYSEPNETSSISGNLENSPPPNDQQDRGEGERGNGEMSTTTVGISASSEDGYNWRKYGQKQVQGSEFPRCYFKCTHPNCQRSQRGGSIAGSDIKNDNLDVGSSLVLSPEFCNPSTSMQAKLGPCFENSDALNISTVSNDEEEDDRGTHGSASLGYKGEGDESESKRRKIDACALEMSGSTRSIRKPRVVVQTTSEVDILDDGYRWRKYGQKVVVKGI